MSTLDKHTPMLPEESDVDPEIIELKRQWMLELLEMLRIDKQNQEILETKRKTKRKPMTTRQGFVAFWKTR